MKVKPTPAERDALALVAAIAADPADEAARFAVRDWLLEQGLDAHAAILSRGGFWWSRYHSGLYRLVWRTSWATFTSGDAVNLAGLPRRKCPRCSHCRTIRALWFRPGLDVSGWVCWLWQDDAVELGMRRAVV